MGFVVELNLCVLHVKNVGIEEREKEIGMKQVDFSGRTEGVLVFWTDHFCTVGVDDPINFVICNSFTLSLAGKNPLPRFPREINKEILFSSSEVYEGFIIPPEFGFEFEQDPPTKIVLNDNIIFHSRKSQDYVNCFGGGAEVYLLTNFEKDIYSILYDKLVGRFDFRGIFQKRERERRKKRLQDFQTIYEDILKYFPKRRNK